MTLYLNGTTGVSGVDGSAGTPAIQGTDANTGISFPAADTIAFNEGGAEVGRFDSSGRLLVGTSTANGNALFQISGDNDNYRPQILRTANDEFPSAVIIAKARGTSNQVVSTNDWLGVVAFRGGSGTGLFDGAYVSAYADAAWGNNDYPTRLVFSTCGDGASTPTARFTIASNGDHRFSNTNDVHAQPDNAVRLGFSGGRWSAVWAATGTIQTSDGRAKTEVTNAVLGSDFINSLRPVSYKWIEGGKRDTGERDPDGNWIYESVPGTRTHWGFIAQEVKEAVDAAGVDFGGYVLTDKDNPDSQQALRYDQFIAPLTKALQETMAELKALKAEVAALKAQ